MPLSAASGAALSALPPLDGALEGQVMRLVAACGLRADAAVAVAGPGAGGAMAALWRRGFTRVESARRVTCPSADQLSDALLIPACSSLDQAREIVDAVLPILRPGGVVGIDLIAARGAAERARLCQMLAHRGLRHSRDAHLRAEVVAFRPEAEAYLPG